MTRKRSLILGFLTLLGAGAIGLLVMMAFGGESGRKERSTDARDAALNGTRGGQTSRGDGDGPVVAQEVTQQRGRDGIARSVLDTHRNPYDSQEFTADMAARASRVTELLRNIQTGQIPKGKTRRDLLIEMQREIRLLGSRLPRGVRDELLEMLTDGEEPWRRLIGEALGQLRGDQETAKLLVKMFELRPESHFTRSAILNALGSMRVKQVLPDLVAMLGAGFDNEEWIVSAIGRLADAQTRLDLFEKLNDPLRPKTRQEIVRVLGQSKDPAVMGRVKRDLADGSKDEQVVLLDILSRTRDPSHSEAVRDVLDRASDPQVRKGAIRALGQFGDAASAGRLVELVDGGSDQDRTAALSALRNIRKADTVNAMAEKWNDLGEQAQQAVLGSGTNLPRPHGKIVEVALESIRSTDKRTRTASAVVLGRSRDPKAIEPLVGLLRNAETTSERTVAITGLLAIGTKESAEAGLRALDVVPNATQRKSYARQFNKVLDRFAGASRQE